MSAIEAIKPEFGLGDQFWIVEIDSVQKRATCPDCGGSGKWQAISPAGRGYLINCPRCSAHYHSNDDLRLNYLIRKPRAIHVTVEGLSKNTWPDEPGALPWEYEVATEAGDHRRIRNHNEIFYSEKGAESHGLWRCLWLNLGHMLTAYSKLPDANGARVCDYELDYMDKATLKRKANEAEYAFCNLLENLRDKKEYGAGDVVAELDRQLVKHGWELTS
jgi:hypothetical protein